MGKILGLFALGLVAVIVIQFVKGGSKGPNVISNLAGSVAGYISALK